MTNIKAVSVSEIEKLPRFQRGSATFISMDALAELLERSPSVSAPTIPEGYALVPIEPTEEMTDAADDVFHEEWKKQREYSIAKAGKEAYASYPFSVAIYKAMLSANQGSDKDEG